MNPQRALLRILAWSVAVFSLALAPRPALAADNPEAGYTQEIFPLLKEYCFECHGEKKKKADISFADFPNYKAALEHRKMWTTALEKVQADEMPPEGARKLKYEHRQTLMRWLRALPKDDVDCEKLATDRTQSFYRGHVMSRRLNREEYDNTIRDLTGLNLHVGVLLPADGSGGEGFDTSGDTLFTSSLGLEKWLEAARQVVETLLPAEPKLASSEIHAARDRLLGAAPRSKRQARARAAIVLEQFARRAFRRPLEPGEIERFLSLFDRAFARGERYDLALRLPLQAMLISPHFLFLIEPEPFDNEGGVRELGAFPLASRLSYFLWSSMPDEELFRLALRGELPRPDVLKAQVRRMVADPKSRSLGIRFAPQWLEINRLGEETRPDKDRFPECDDELLNAMRAEVAAFFNHVVRQNRPLSELIDCDYAFANERLAQLYGLEGVSGKDLRKIKLNGGGARGGVLGLAAVHAANSYPLRTSPVLRGKWVLEALLGESVPPPPPDVPALQAETKTITAASLREQLEIHRKSTDCSGCHNRMDPLGFGLESFDVLGRLRTSDGGLPVDATGVLPSGERFSGPAGLKKILLARREQILKHLIRKLAGYALGRPLNQFDECIVRDSMSAMAQQGESATLVLETIVTSKPFRYRFYPKSESAGSL